MEEKHFYKTHHIRNFDIAEAEEEQQNQPQSMFDDALEQQLDVPHDELPQTSQLPECDEDYDED